MFDISAGEIIIVAIGLLLLITIVSFLWKKITKP